MHPNPNKTDKFIIETRYIEELDMYYVYHNSGKMSFKLFDSPDKEEAEDMARMFTHTYETGYLDALGFALHDIQSAKEIYDDLV